MFAAVAAAALLLTGCVRGDAAAVVDGRTISQSGLQAAVQQIQEASGQAPHPSQILSSLIIGPTVEGILADRGAAISDAAARSNLATLPNPEPYIVELMKVNMGVQSLTNEEREEAIARIQELDVEVSPRYGTFDPAQGQILPESPNWLADPTQ